ncbi:MAG: Uncharacterized MFS-type transporter, partial [uncultured Microvirga sp.]
LRPRLVALGGARPGVRGHQPAHSRAPRRASCRHAASRV